MRWDVLNRLRQEASRQLSTIAAKTRDRAQRYWSAIAARFPRPTPQVVEVQGDLHQQERQVNQQDADQSTREASAELQESESRERASTSRQKDIQRRPWRLSSGWSSVVVQFLALVVLGIYTYYTANQWKAVENSNETAAIGIEESRRQAIASLKASQHQAEAALAESRRQSEAALAASQEQANRALEESRRQSDIADRRAGEALEVSRSQTTESLRQLESTDRPWVTVTFPQSAAFQFREAGAVLALTYTLKNIGRSPAVNVELQANVIPLTQKDWLVGPFKWQRQICDPYSSHKATDPTRGFSLIPAEEVSDNFSVTLDAQSIAAVNVLPSPGTIDDGAARFYAVLVGCVTYTFSNSLKTHITGFIYNIVRRVPDDPHVYLIKALPVGASEEVELMRFYFGGQQSD